MLQTHQPSNTDHYEHQYTSTITKVSTIQKERQNKKETHTRTRKGSDANHNKIQHIKHKHRDAQSTSEKSCTHMRLHTGRVNAQHRAIFKIQNHHSRIRHIEGTQTSHTQNTRNTRINAHNKHTCIHACIHRRMHTLHTLHKSIHTHIHTYLNTLHA